MENENFTFTPELMAEIDAGTKTAADIPIERQAEFRDILQDRSLVPAAPVEEAAPVVIPEQAAVATTTPEAEEDESSVLESTISSQRTAVEEAEAAQKKFDTENGELEAIIAKPLPDRYDDDYDDALEARNGAIRKQNELLISQRREDVERGIASQRRTIETQAETLVSKHIERIGSTYPALKLEIPYSQMKTQYGSYAQKLVTANGGTAQIGTPEFHTELQAAYKRLKEDGEFAAKPEVAPPAWLDKFSILRTAELRAAKTGLTLQEALGATVIGQEDKWLAKAPAAADPAQQARDNAEALTRRNAEPKVADVNGGSSNKGVSNIPAKGDKEACRRYLTIFNDKLQKMAAITDADRDMAANAREWLGEPD